MKREKQKVRIILTSHPASRALPFPKQSKDGKLEIKVLQFAIGIPEKNQKEKKKQKQRKEKTAQGNQTS